MSLLFLFQAYLETTSPGISSFPEAPAQIQKDRLQAPVDTVLIYLKQKEEENIYVDLLERQKHRLIENCKGKIGRARLKPPDT